MIVHLKIDCFISLDPVEEGGGGEEGGREV